MLNIFELEKEFDKMLYSLTKKDLVEWLASVEEREAMEKLQKEGKLVFKFNYHTIANSTSLDSDFIDIKTSFDYSLAA